MDTILVAIGNLIFGLVSGNTDYIISFGEEDAASGTTDDIISFAFGEDTPSSPKRTRQKNHPMQHHPSDFMKVFGAELEEFKEQHPELKGFRVHLEFKKIITSTPKYKEWRHCCKSGLQ